MHATISEFGYTEFPGWLEALSQKLNVIEYRGRKPNIPNGLDMQTK